MNLHITRSSRKVQFEKSQVPPFLSSVSFYRIEYTYQSVRESGVTVLQVTVPFPQT